MTTPAPKTPHTPGPWEVHRSEVTNLRTIVMAGVRWVADGRPVAYRDVTNDEAENNARLIAAAPEMADALEALLGCVSENGEFSRLTDRSFVEVLAIAADALKKAGLR